MKLKFTNYLLKVKSEAILFCLFFSVAGFTSVAQTASSCFIGGINVKNILNYHMVFTNGSVDANWQSASKGFIGNVAIDGLQANERTSGSFAYAGTISTNDASLSAWQNIVNNNIGQAFSSLNQTSLLAQLETNLNSVFSQINALPVTPTYNGVPSSSLNGLNTQNGIAQTIVINITSGFTISSQINITGDANDIFILRWDEDMNPTNGYQGKVKFQSGGAIVPLGALKPSNFLNVAGDIGSSGGGSTPALPYPQGPRYNNGTGALITNGDDFSGGGFFTGYWFTTGDPVSGETSSLSNAIFVGGWYSTTNKFSMTSGTSGVYVAPLCDPGTGSIGDFVFKDYNANGIQDAGETGIAGVTVKLTYPNGTIINTTTDINGNYNFPNLLTGNTYSVTFTTPAGYLASPSNVGANDNVDSDPLSGVVTNVTVSAGVANTSVDAGFYLSTCIGEASNFGLLGLENGNFTINSGTTLLANVGYSKGVTSNINQKITTFNGTSFVHSMVASFSYTAATYQPSGGIIQNNSAADFKLNAANISAISASSNYASLTTNVSFGNLTTNQNINRVNNITVVAMGSLNYNSNTITFIGQAGQDDAFIINVAGSFDFSQSTVILNNVRPERVVWNFPNASNILINKASTVFKGTILAPIGSVIYHNPASFEGAIIAQNIAVHSDFNLTQKNLDIPCYTTSLGSIGDRVWLDANANGIQDANETTSIEGVTVQLKNASGTVIATTSTNSTGNYLFTNLPTGTYSVVFPTTFNGGMLTIANAGIDDNIDSDASQATGQTGLITLAAGQNITNVDAGFYQLNLNLGNSVWYDKNNDGIKQITEAGIGGVTVKLYADANNDNVADGAAIATTTTTADGIYSFAGLAPGNYIVGVITPTGYAAVTTNGGDPDNDIDNDNNGINTTVVGEVRSNAISLSTGFEPASAIDGDGTNGNLTVDFALTGSGTIGNFVWNDLNKNGIQDAGEPGLPNVTVTLTNPDGTTTNTITDANGAYLFNGLLSGTYNLSFATPTGGYIASPSNVGSNDEIDSDPVNGTVSNIVLSAGEMNNSVDAGFIKLISLTGNVWHDVNGMSDNLVNNSGAMATPPAALIPVGLRAYLVNNTTGLVETVAFVSSSTNTFTFPNVTANTNYYIILSNIQALVGNPPPSASLPTGWQNTGEKLGAGTGSDGVINGRLNVPVGTTNITNANFGIKLKSGEVVIG